MLPRPSAVIRCAAVSVVLLASSLAVAGAAAGPGAARGAGGAQPTGAQIFRERCAGCHGEKGEGTARYRKPLAGSQTVAQLAAFIGRSMPPGPVKKCAGEDARRVAAFINDAFYSPVAQARNQPARIELSHLTVRQYRNAVADLVGTFRSQPEVRPSEHGLRGEYFKSRRFDDGERVLQRVDPEVHFDFGKSGPAPQKFDPHTFSIRWNGSVLAPDTGDYDFVVRTEHGFQLWVNDLRHPLIDNSVKSGSDTVFRGSIYLLGGRTYPLRLEFTKATQGVDDTDQLKNRPVAPASISLEWRPPHLTDAVIPARCLFPASSPELFVVTAPFPPDDRSRGYERGTSISKEWDDATTEAALETAGYVTAHLRELSGVPEDAKDRPERLRDFCRRFAERAFRRPLTSEMEQLVVERQFQRAPDLDTAVKRVVLLVLKSPEFLYRGLGADDADPYVVASRLSFGMWDTLPDADLLKAAAAGALSTREQVKQQADRMLADPRAWFKLREFLLQWLKVDQYPDLTKDAKRYPGFDPAVAADLRTSLELSLEAAAWTGRSDFRDLLLSDEVYLNGRLAKVYGVNLPPDAPFRKVELDPQERAGILTHPYVLACFAHLDASSPIHRGVLIARNLLGRTLQPPPQAFAPLPVDLHPNLTTRQRVMLQTQPAACAGCHGMINPLGFTLEEFDAIGHLRSQENGQPVDTSGAYRPLRGKPVRFTGARDLAEYLASSPEAHAAFVEKLFQFLVQQPVRAYGPEALPQLERAFGVSGYSVREEMVEAVTVSALMRNNPSVAEQPYSHTPILPYPHTSRRRLPPGHGDRA